MINTCRKDINMDPINLQTITSKQILIQNDRYKVICFIFEPGKGLPNHTHNGFATIQVISGEVDMHFTDGPSYLLKAGDFLGFNARDEHHVIAKETSKVLVTIMF